ncbi:hypothetical protein EV200_102218 [Pedobacter psychrotolerans]|nr:hypothetical protein [Pedobacter psychrotolerans]TCO28801.1 hypothetical protein EV200_102218 [Pedobacter psychrotolerans]
MKTLIHSIAITSCFHCSSIQKKSELKDQSIIINKIIDIVYVDEVRPKSVLISEQLLSNFDQYLTNFEGEKKDDSLTILMNGKWNYLKQIQSHSYSKDWKKISLSKSINGKKMISEKKKGEEICFSLVQFSPDDTRAFVVYSRTSNHIAQSTVFFFFEKKNGNWTNTAHYIPFFD